MSGPNDGSTHDLRQPRRYLIATAVAHYSKCADWDRPALVEAREQIIALFTQELGYHHHTTLGLDPTRAQLTDHLRAFCRSDDRREDDLVVIYISGHGEVVEDGHEHVLLMADTEPDDVSYTSLPTADLVRALRGTKVRRLLLILDTCYSGQGGNELAASALERLGAQWAPSATSPGLVVVSSAQPNQQARAGLFPQLLSEAVGNRATAGHAPTHLSVSAVVEQMNKHPDRPGYQHINLSLLGLTGEPPDFFTNPRHNVRLTDVDLALQDAAEFDAYALQRETEFSSRFLVRAMGYSGNAGQGWWFCGRHRALAELAAWLNQTTDTAQDLLFEADVPVGECVRVVTAGPGSGKTAVLGLVGALTMPDRRRTVPLDSLGLDADLIPAESSIDVVMYAQNLTDSQVLAGLAAAAGFRCTTVGEFLEGVDDKYRSRGRPFTVLIDALDEAATPATLCSQIVRPLIEHARGRIRLLLGTRPYLLDCLGLSNRPTHRDGPVIDLDSPRYTDRQALLAYTIRNLVQSHATSPYRRPPFSDRPERLRPIAHAVADAAGTSFLVARFAAYTLASADIAVPDPHDARWRASLPRHAGQAMRDDLAQRLGPDAQRATDLLRPLAYAEGQGLPWEDIWAPLATAISGRPYTDADLLWLRRNAGSYVVEAIENGRSAYRLYHQALTEHLRENTDEAAVHSAFVDTLTDQAPYRGDATRDWSRAHPYTLHHLATHAATAHRIDDILTIPEYLVHAHPPSLAPHLHHATSSQARLTAAVYRMNYDRHSAVSPNLRRTTLTLNAARAKATTLLQQLNQFAQPGEWVPTWATGYDFTPALRHTLHGHDSPVNAVACTVLDDHPIAVIATNTGFSRGEVFVWDLGSGEQIAGPFRHDGPVSAVACTVLDGRPVAVTGTGFSSGEVLVWDLGSGEQIAGPFPHDGTVSAVACTVLDGRPVAVTSTAYRRGEVLVWDLGSGEQIAGPFRHDGTVSAVACTVLDSGPVAVTSTRTRIGEVFVWDLGSGEQIAGPFFHDGLVNAVACTVLDGRPVAVTGTSTSFGIGEVFVWDLGSGEQIAGPFPHDGLVNAVACTVLDGRPVAVTSTGFSRGEVLVWDLSSGEQIAGPFTHAQPVTTVACIVVDELPIIVSGCTDGAARAWRFSATHERAGSPSSLQPVSAMACTVLEGRSVAVIVTSTGFSRGEVLMWDLSSGEQTAALFRHDGPVNAVACTVLDGRPVAVTSTGFRRGEVFVWDLGSGEQIAGPFPHDGPVSAVACTVLDSRPIAVTGTGFSSGEVFVWDLGSGEQIAGPFPHDGPVSAVACTVLDSRPIAVTAVSGEVFVWDLGSGEQIAGPFPHDGPVSAVACTVLESRPIAVIGTDTAVHMWDLRTQRIVQQVVTADLRCLGVCPDGRLVVALGRDIAVLERDEGLAR
ncbi:caspase family protein [Streptomyces sp. BH-SS-21]|uniref:Caspase family protein n=1 Tax=Streptomyces liliiviolaceus TaxID=2823109 RepID=A0A940XUU0_9ACTN|nr:caspase family protein [Streptomyces liliiviolaceus]MBQ0850325.1 caspase family protein [Streptomyces liliiviolaceus]